MKYLQIVVIGIVIAVMTCLYLLPVKGLVKPKEGHANGMATSSRPVANIGVSDVSEPAKTAIGSALAAKINDLEARLKQASGDDEKTKLQKELAQQWDDVNQPAPAAFYYLELARKQNDFNDWLNAGSRFNDAYKVTQDTLIQPALVTNAVDALQHATKLKPDNLDAKSGLGIAYVNGGAPSPMQGIALLLDVVKQDPNNRNANLNLGLFAMKSGQYEKAVIRFKALIAQKPELEPYFYLAESYKQLGDKTEAIEAYTKCKAMMPDPVFRQRIDDFIKELKN